MPEKGTVGASGDLAPLSHLALGMLGEGRMWSPSTGWGDARYVRTITLRKIKETMYFFIQVSDMAVGDLNILREDIFLGREVFHPPGE